MTTSEYQKRQESGKVIFDVKPASCPKNKSALIIGAPLLFFLLIGVIAAGFLGKIVCLALIGLIVYLAMYKDWRPSRHRVSSTFSVTPAGVDWNSRIFRKEDIHRLLVRNGISKNEVANAFIASGAAGIGAFAVGQQYRSRIATVTNSLDLEAGGQAYMLAGGMSETTAFGLMTDVNRILGLHA